MNSRPPARFEKLSPARRTAAIAIRWTSIPLAILVAIAPISVMRSEYRRTERLIPTAATILDARVVSAARVLSEWEVYVRYPVRGADTENSVRIWTSSDLDKGDTVTLMVDPRTGDAEEDLRTMSWIAVLAGLVIAAFMLVVGFGMIGKMLRRDRLSRES